VSVGARYRTPECSSDVLWALSLPSLSLPLPLLPVLLLSLWFSPLDDEEVVLSCRYMSVRL